MNKKIIMALIFTALTASACSGSDNSISILDTVDSAFKNKLPIPPLLEPVEEKNISRYTLEVQQGTYEFIKGEKVYTYGYNGPLLGPTIKVKRGEKVSIEVRNSLREYTTVHWHGMLVPGDMDGGPHQVISPGKKWTASFTVNQPAATAWYHPHGLGTTARQVYMGLAGLFIVEDENSEKLNIPKEYGVNDIPLIVQDKRLTTEGVPLYLTGMRDIMTGMLGNTILVNGVITPHFTVTGNKYRLRILNGSNARVYNFSFNDNNFFYVIATDGGFLEKPVKRNNIILSPGERIEIIADFSKYSDGENVKLVSGNIDIMEFRVNGKEKETAIIPERLTTIERYDPSASKRSRLFQLEGMGHMVAINGKRMNINRIDEYMNYQDTETWTITSSTAMHGRGMMGGGMMRMMGPDVLHNFHAHGVHFLILSRNGIPPEDHEKGWKDTVLLNENEEVKVITRFLYRGIFMYHCHILEHEDNGMMGQFKVK